MNFGDLLSDDPTNASTGGGGGGTPAHPRAGRISSGPPPGGGGGPGKNLSSFVKGVDGTRGNLNNSSDRRGGTTPESLVDESDPNHNVFGHHVGGLGGLSHDLSFLEDMEDAVPIPPVEINLKSNSTPATTSSGLCSTTSGPGGLSSDFENAESVYLDELADLLDERSIAISAPSLITCGGQVDQLVASKTSATFTNIPLTVSTYGSKTMMTSSVQPTSSSILNTTLSRPPPLSQSSTPITTTMSTTTSLHAAAQQPPSSSNYTLSSQLLQLQQTNSLGTNSIGGVKQSNGQRLVTITNTSPNLQQNLQSMKPVSITASSNSVSPSLSLGNSRVTNGGGSIVSGASTSPTGSENLSRSLTLQQTTNEQRQQPVNRQKQPIRRTNATGTLPPGASPTNVSPQQISSPGTGGSPTTSGHGGSPAGAALAAVSAMLRSLNVPKECLAPLAADSLAGFVFTVDGSEGDGKVDFVSDSVRDHVGKTAQQIRGQSIFNFLHRDDHPRLQSVFSNRNLPLGKRNTFSCRFLTASGSPASANVSSASAVYESLQVTYVVVPKPQQPPIRGAAKPAQVGPTTRLVCVARKVNVSAGAGPPGTPATPAVTTSLLLSGGNGVNNVITQPLLTTVATHQQQQQQSNNEINNPSFSSSSTNKMELFTTKVDPTSFKILQADIVPQSQSSNSTTSTSTTSSSSPLLMSNGLLRASMAARTGTMTGKDLLEFCHPDDHDILREHFNRTLRQNGAGGDTSKVYRMRNLIGNTSTGKGINGGQNGGQSQQRLVHVQTYSTYYKSDVPGGMPTNHHHGHAHASNKDKGYVISTHSVITSPPTPISKSPNPQDTQVLGGRQARYDGQAVEQHRVGGGNVYQHPAALNQYLNSNIRGGQVVSGSSGTVSSSTTHAIGGHSTSANLPRTSPPTGAVASSSSRLSTLLLSTSSLRGTSSTTHPFQTLSINSPSHSTADTQTTASTRSEGSHSNEATQKNLLLKQLLNVSFPSSASGSSAGAAAAAAQASAAAAASSASGKVDNISPGTQKSEKSPSPPTANSRILQLLSQNNDNMHQQHLSHRLTDRSQSYGMSNSNLNRQQPQNVPISSRPFANPTSTITSAGMSSLQSIGGANSNNILSNRQSLKRAASDPLGGVTGAKQQIPQQQPILSAVCSENPSLASLLSKPPAQASRTVPPPVPTKWHQEPKEKLPRDIMRKFLPPHPAERASSSRSKGVNLSPIGNESSLLQTVSPSTSSSIGSHLTTSTSKPMVSFGNSGINVTATTSNSLSITSLTNPSGNSSNIPMRSASSNPSLRGLSNHKLSLDTLEASQLANRAPLPSGSNTQSCIASEPSDDDPMLDAILNDVIEIQEKSPPLTVGQTRGPIGHKRNTRIHGNRNAISTSPDSMSSPASAAILAEHSQISDIEKYLASAENTPPRENSPLQSVPIMRSESDQINQSQQLQSSSQITAIKSLPPPPPSSSSAALSSPSLTSILSAPPIAAISVPMRNIIGGNRSLLPTTTAVPTTLPNVPVTSSIGLLSSSGQTQQPSSKPSDPATLLVPRMNELLNVPPNVSLSDCPDLTSLIHLQNAEQENQRRRRISSGGGQSPMSTSTSNISASVAPNMGNGSNNSLTRQGWQGNRTTIQLPHSSPQGLPLSQGAGATLNRTSPPVTSSLSMLHHPTGPTASVLNTSGYRLQSGSSNAVSTSASSNAIVHPPPTNILAQHLQRGMSKNSNMSNVPNTSRSNAQIRLGLQQSPPTSMYPSSSNPSHHILINSNGNQNVVGKSSMTSPPTVSKTTTLSLISSSGFVASNAGRESSIYSMPSPQHLLPINNPASGVVGMLSSTSASRQTQNQQSPSNPLQQQMNFVGSGNPVGTSVDQLQVGRRASYSGASSGGSVIIGAQGVGAPGLIPPTPSPQLQGLLMQNQINPISQQQQQRVKESHQQIPNGMQHVRRRASGSATSIVNALQPSPNNTRMGLNNMAISFQGGNTLNATTSTVVNNGGIIHATRTPASRNRQLSGPLQNSNPMSGQLQNPSTSQGIPNRLSGSNLQSISNQNPLVISRASHNLHQLQVQPSNQIQAQGSHYVQVPSNQLPLQQPSISQHSLAQQPHVSPQQQQQPHNSHGVGGQSLLQQLLSE